MMPQTGAQPAEGPILRTVRRLLLVIVAAGMLGTAADLILLEHYEELWQLFPLVLIAVAAVVVGAVALRGGWIALAALRVTMVLLVAAGALGLLLHYQGSREFQQEMDPSLAGWPLVIKVITAKAPPALAPAGLVQLGLLGLLYTYRHPDSSRRHHSIDPSTAPAASQ